MSSGARLAVVIAAVVSVACLIAFAALNVVLLGLIGLFAAILSFLIYAFTTPKDPPL